MSTPNISHEPQCTSKCRSHRHAKEVLSAITKGGLEEEEVVISYLQWLCVNAAQVTDDFGRTALHFAASCGKGKIVKWLLTKKNCKGNVRDWESGWTPLHRSLFYGQLFTAVLLIKNGASLTTLDHDSFSPINIVMKDRPSYVDYCKAGLNEVYVWGTNHNYNLGLGSSTSRSTPESLDAFRKENINIERVIMRKFHTVFLSRGGQVYVCGHGYRGRLGVSLENVVLKPQMIRSISKEVCVQVASGTDHNVLLMESGSVWTFGSNEYHQLGHVPPPEKLSSPRMITEIKTGNKTVVGICAGIFHTVICFEDVLYTFGLNAGQLGHLEQGNYLQTAPRIVSALTKQNIKFTHLAACHAATVCVTKSGDIFVLHEYQCRKIASKQNDVLKLVVSGGSLNPSACPGRIKEGGDTELKIVILMATGRIMIWSKSCPHLTPCFFSINRSIRIIDLEIFNTGLIFATSDGEGFLASVIPPKNKITKDYAESRIKPALVTSFHEWIEKDDSFQIKLKCLPNIHRAVSVACDYKGRNFAILQAHPKASLFEVPQSSVSEMNSNLRNLLKESFIGDGIQDCVLKVKNDQFPAHRFILASRSKLLSDKISKSLNISIDNINRNVMDDILEYLYTNSCRWLTCGHLINITQLQSSTPDLITSTRTFEKRSSASKNLNQASLKLMREAAKRLELKDLEEKLNKVAVIDERIQILEPFSTPILKFSRTDFPGLCDLEIFSHEGTIFRCHKCILIASSDYFRGMLTGCNWSEASSSFTMPVPKEILKIVIDFLYTNEAPELSKCDDVEFICNVLVTADSFLLTILKELCEIKLTEILTLKNVSDILEIAWTYNASQLKASAMHFIGLNLPAILEMKSLNSLSDEMLIELTKCYRKMIAQMCYRCITPYETSPSLEMMRAIHSEFPEILDCDLSAIIKEKKKTRKAKKLFNRNDSISEETTNGNSRKAVNIFENVSKHDTSGEDNSRVFKAADQHTVPHLVPSSPIELVSPITYPSIWLHGEKDIDDAFPDLLGGMENKNSFGDKHSTNENFKSRVKLSQKQRKKQQSALVLSPNMLLKNASPTNAWGLSKLPEVEASLSDIMSLENDKQEHFYTSDEKNSISRVFDESLSPNDNLSKLKLGSPVTFIKENASFANILFEEKQQADYLAKHQSKPLHFIQLEDQAMEDLIEFYKARDNPEEFVSVQRVLPKFTATPIWKPTNTYRV